MELRYLIASVQDAMSTAARPHLRASVFHLLRRIALFQAEKPVSRSRFFLSQHRLASLDSDLPVVKQTVDGILVCRPEGVEASFNSVFVLRPRYFLPIET